jgi:DNA-binding transcriptional MerR regulator
MSDETRTYGVEELAERAGVSRRTVRYYVQRGLVPAPLGLGRGNHYTEDHLAALVRVRELQERGVPLDEIGDRLRGAQEPGTAASPSEAAQTKQTTWTRVELGDDVELHLRGRRLSDEQVRKLEQTLKKVLGEFST